MPQVTHMLAGALNAVKGYIGGQPSQDTSEGTVNAEKPTTYSHAKTSLPQDRKRAYDTSQEQADQGPNTKKRRESMSQRSQQRYPNTVTPITIPRGPESSPEPAEQVAMSGKKRPSYGAFKPHNSLHDNRHALSSTGKADLRSQAKRAHPPEHQLSTRSSAGQNVRATGGARSHDTDGAYGPVIATNKRQKIGDGDIKSSPRRLSIDLTGEVGYNDPALNGVITGVNGKPPNRAGSTSHWSTESQQTRNHFEGGEYDKVAQYTETAPARKPRKARSSQNFDSKLSKGGSEFVVIQDESQVEESEKNKLWAVVPGTTSESPNSRRYRPHKPNNVPPITIGEGVDIPCKRGELDILLQTKRHGKLDPNEHAYSSRRASNHFGEVAAKEQRLNSVFRRIESPQEQSKKLKATAKMKSVSHTTSHAASVESSSDELAGPNNLKVKQAPGKLTREKTGPVSTQTLHLQRPSSPSDIRPSSLTNFPEQTKPVRSQTHTQPDQEQDTMPITTFYAKSCIVQSGHALLRYTYDPKPQIDLFVNGEIQMVQGSKCSVSLTGTEVRRISYTIGNRLVFLEGSSNEISGGQICISFKDYKGVKWFIETMCDISTSTSIKRILDTQLEKTFSHTSKSIQMVWNKFRQRRRSNSGEEEQIQYEKEESPQQRSSRTQKTVSKFFDPQRRTTRQSLPAAKAPTPPPPERWTHINKPRRWNQPVTYPKTGPRRVTVDFQDLERLDEGEFLNDNLVSFALKRIEESMAPEHKEKVYFFNSFFYTSLMKKNGKVGFNYEAVQRWTKNQDLFSTPFIVVPINANLHWFVAIICNLQNLNRELDASDDDEESEPAFQNSTPDLKNPRITEGIRDLSVGSESAGELEGKDGVYSFDDDGVVEVQENTRHIKRGKRKPPPPRKFDPESPTIITFDSFGLGRSAEVRNLKDYLKCEAETKRSMSIDTKALQGVTAKNIPEQDNYCDCGVYLVGYIQQFAKNPRKFINKVLQKEASLQRDFADFSPSQTRTSIRDELLKLDKDADDERFANRQVKMEAKRAAEDGPKQKSPLPQAQGDATNTQSQSTPTRLRSAESQASAPAEPPTSVTLGHSASQDHETFESQGLEIGLARSLGVERTATPPWMPMERKNAPDNAYQVAQTDEGEDMLLGSHVDENAVNRTCPSFESTQVSLQNDEEVADSDDERKGAKEPSQASTIPEL